MNRKPSFNIIENDWIPALMPDGSCRDISMREALTGDAVAINGEVPACSASMLRILAAFAYSVYGERVVDAMASMKKSDKKQLDSYIAKWNHRFDLFDSERPFFQRAGLVTVDSRGENPKPINDIATTMPSGNNRILFGRSHSLDDDGYRMPPAECTRWLIHLQNMEVRGGQQPRLPDCEGKPSNKKRYAKFWSSAKDACVTLIGRNLRETIGLNAGRILPQDGDGPFWEQDELPSPNVTSRACRGPVDQLTWESRIVRLIPSEDGYVEKYFSTSSFEKKENSSKKDVDPTTKLPDPFAIRRPDSGDNDGDDDDTSCLRSKNRLAPAITQANTILRALPEELVKRAAGIQVLATISDRSLLEGWDYGYLPLHMGQEETAVAVDQAREVASAVRRSLPAPRGATAETNYWTHVLRGLRVRDSLDGWEDALRAAAHGALPANARRLFEFLIRGDKDDQESATEGAVSIPQENRWVYPAEAAQILGVSARTVAVLARLGVLRREGKVIDRASLRNCDGTVAARIKKASRERQRPGKRFEKIVRFAMVQARRNAMLEHDTRLESLQRYTGLNPQFVAHPRLLEVVAKQCARCGISGKLPAAVTLKRGGKEGERIFGSMMSARNEAEITRVVTALSKFARIRRLKVDWANLMSDLQRWPNQQFRQSVLDRWAVEFETSR